MYSTSCTSGLYLRIWGWVGRYAGGAPVLDVRSFFRPGGAREGARAARQNPRELCWPADLSTSRSPLQGNVAMIHRAMRLSFTRCLFSCFLRASGINSHQTDTWPYRFFVVLAVFNPFTCQQGQQGRSDLMVNKVAPISSSTRSHRQQGSR